MPSFGSGVFFESTANGVNHWYERWCSAAPLAGLAQQVAVVEQDLQQCAQSMGNWLTSVSEAAQITADDFARIEPLLRQAQQRIAADMQNALYGGSVHLGVDLARGDDVTAVAVAQIQDGQITGFEITHAGTDYVGGWRSQDPAAEEKATQLLKEWLTPVQLRDFDKHQYFFVRGSKTRTRYKIMSGTTFNVVELDAKGDGIAKLCFQPVGASTIGDTMLAQKIMLETDEPRALKIANRSAMGCGGTYGGGLYNELAAVTRRAFRNIRA